MKVKLFMLVFVTIFLQSCGQNTVTKNVNQKNTVSMTNEEWKKKLNEEQYYVLREKGTEKPFTGEFLFTKEKGVYKCAGCGTELFTDEMKFESHCGWPSFDKEISGGKITQIDDTSHGMRRTEIICTNCGGHLGHIFDDGPTETGKRYCVNSVSLSFEPAIKKAADIENKTEIITLAGGCFWCIEAIFEGLKGVEKVESGYANGLTKNPTYKEVCTGNTGYAEVVQVTFKPEIMPLKDLLEVFFALHDPTTLNQQGADKGTQYRSAIFYSTPFQKETADKIIATLNANKAFENPIVTEVTALTAFYKAENYHQEYYAINKEEPYCKAVIRPKIDKLHQLFSDKIK